MSNDPYEAGKLSMGDAYALKSDVSGKLVVVLDSTLENRALSLITPPSRCLKQYEIHELIITDEEDAKPGSTVNRVAYFGFFEVEQGGVIVSGDEFYANGKCIGVLAGFDETHMPNHENIVIKAKEFVSGFDRGYALDSPVKFHKKQ